MTKVATSKDKILVIVDPAHDPAIALDRAIITSKLRQNQVYLHLFFVVDKDNSKLKSTNKKLYRDGNWLKKMTYKLERENIEYSIEFCWSTRWYKAILQCANIFKPSIILVPDYNSEKTPGLFANAKWALLRKSFCPVMLVRANASNQRKRILAAINIQNESPDYIELNHKILTKGLAIANLYAAEFFVVNAYPDSLHFPNRELIIKQTQLHSKYVHAEQGKPAEVIARHAKSIDADLVIIGTRAKSGGAALMRGHMSEKILTLLTQDVITFA